MNSWQFEPVLQELILSDIPGKMSRKQHVSINNSTLNRIADLLKHTAQTFQF